MRIVFDQNDIAKALGYYLAANGISTPVSSVDFSTTRTPFTVSATVNLDDSAPIPVTAEGDGIVPGYPETRDETLAEDSAAQEAKPFAFG